MKKQEQLNLFSSPPMVAGETPAREVDMLPLETGGEESKFDWWCYTCGPVGSARMYEIAYLDLVKVTYLCDDCVPKVLARPGVKYVRRWEHD